MPSKASIEVFQEKHMVDLIRMRRAFMNSKHCCCILPLGAGSDSETRQEFKKCPEKTQTTAVAVDASEKVVGYIQLIFEGMHCDIHKAKPGEAYVYMVAVDPEARGMGVGTGLLAWGEELARGRGCTFMSLEVIHGNAAIGLYERLGYVVKPPSFFSRLCQFPLVCCLMGPLICPSGSPSYCNFGRLHYMEKQLQ